MIDAYVQWQPSTRLRKAVNHIVRMHKITYSYGAGTTYVMQGFL